MALTNAGDEVTFPATRRGACLAAAPEGAAGIYFGNKLICRTSPVSSAASGSQRHFHFPQLRSLLPQFEPSLLMSLVSELRSLNLLRAQEGSIRMPEHSEVLLELTPIGQRFVERFI